MGKQNRKNRTAYVDESYSIWDAVFTIMRTVSVALLIISVSIAVPLLWRGFYYMHINVLHLDEITPWNVYEIREAFDQMMDYCMRGAAFSTGVLKWSEEGMQHFEDCRRLFQFDIHVLIVNTMLTAALYAIRRLGIVRELRPKGRGPLFWGGLIPVILLAVTGTAVCVADFDKAFVVFHTLFFPGKTNWLFDPAADEIIRILPEVYFRNCAILIAAVMLLLSLILIAADIRKGNTAKSA